MDLERLGSAPDETDGADRDAAAPDSGLARLVIDLVRHPRRAMAALSAHPGRRWVWPMLVLGLLAILAAVSGLPQSQAYARDAAMAQFQDMAAENPEMVGDQSPEVVVGRMTGGTTGDLLGTLGAVAGAIGVVVGMLVAAAVLHFLGTVLGGQQTFTQMLAVSTWAHGPLVLREALRIGDHLLGNWDASPAGLSGLVACTPFVKDCRPSFLEPVLAQIEVWNLWYWVLLGVAVAVVSHVSRRKAVAAVAVLVLLQVALGMVGVVTGRTISGMFG